MELKIFVKQLILFALFVVCVTACTSVNDDYLRKIKFDQDWKFYLGKVENAETETFNDSDWRCVDLPHDWSIEPLSKSDSLSIGPFSKQSLGGYSVGQTVGGEGWYRKTFVIDPQDVDKRHILYFEGVYAQSEVWVNGNKANVNVYGYSSFRCDITPYCHSAGKLNTIAVKVVNEGKNSRWYAGSGIYRHVWLIKTFPIYLDEWETVIRTESLCNNNATISVQ